MHVLQGLDVHVLNSTLGVSQSLVSHNVKETFFEMPINYQLLKKEAINPQG